MLLVKRLGLPLVLILSVGGSDSCRRNNEETGEMGEMMSQSDELDQMRRRIETRQWK